MEILNPQIELKDYLFSRIYNDLQGDVVNWIVDKAEYMTDDEDWREYVNGNFMKLDEHLLPDYFHLCQDIQSTLVLDEPVEFYVTGNASINAYSVLAQKQGHHEMLARKIKALKKQVVLVTWNMEEKDSTSPALKEEVTMHIDLGEIAKEDASFLGKICDCIQ